LAFMGKSVFGRLRVDRRSMIVGIVPAQQFAKTTKVHGVNGTVKPRPLCDFPLPRLLAATLR
jgi:hypothetical protein